MHKFIKIIISIAIPFMLFSAKGQVVLSGKITSQHPVIYEWYFPIYNYLNSDAVDQPLSGKSDKDSFNFAMNVSMPSFIKLSIKDTLNNFLKRSQFLVIPGDSIHIKFDPYSSKIDWIKFSGSNAAGNQYFDSLNYRPISKHKPEMDLFKKIIEGYRGNIVENIINISVDFLTPFRELYKNSLISKEYFNYMDSTLRVMNFSGLSSSLVSATVQLNKVDKEWRDSIVAELFNTLDPLSPNLTALYQISNYKDLYYKYHTYKKLGIKNISAFSKIDTIIMGRKMKVHNELSDLLYVKNTRDKEDLWALRLLMVFQWSTGKFSQVEIDDYSHMFPESKWLPVIDKHYAKTKPNNRLPLTAKDSSAVIILSPDSISGVTPFNFFLPVMKKMNSKYAFIDLWASWCGPCMESFKQNPVLDSLLQELGFLKLYISIDKNGYEKNWLNAIYKFYLKGYHVRANETLIKELLNMTQLKDISELGIPRYILLNSSGKILNNDLPSPLSFTKLKELLIQISN